MPPQTDYLSKDFVFMYPSRFLNWKWAFMPINVVLLGIFFIIVIGSYVEVGAESLELTWDNWAVPLFFLIGDLYFTGNYFRQARWPLQFQRDEDGLTCIPIWGKRWKIKWEDIRRIEDVPRKWSIKIYANVPWRKRYYFYIQKDLDGFKYLMETIREHVRECEI
ncbi:MAG: hypothetical protein HYS08_06945 [Chlamydiae bacterium]|nr:hypothetical protein [Chlamydiota bacterium]MBI3266402.1 hypothetical protein [Chlamydiota bacterium]